MTERNVGIEAKGPEGPAGEWGMNGPSGPIVTEIHSEIDILPSDVPAGPSGEWGVNGPAALPDQSRRAFAPLQGVVTGYRVTE